MKVLAIRPLEYPPKNLKAGNIHRNLKAGKLYRFYSGVEINDNGEQVKLVDFDKVPENLYNPSRYASGSNVNDVQVDICAVVGQNGSGKSSLIDLMLRIVNNVATCIIGEEYRFNKAAHLHFIPNVYGEVYYLIDDYILCLRCCGNKISAIPFCRQGSVPIYFMSQLSKTIKVNGENVEMGWQYELTEESINFRKTELDKWLSLFCYNIVLNYSLHSFNPVSYKDESTPEDKERDIRVGTEFNVQSWDDLVNNARKWDRPEIIDEAKSWIAGIFHKNDGYMTPIVLTPFRSCGNIDINKENKLAEERLISLLFLQDKNRNLVFKTINEKLEVTGFETSIDNDAVKLYAGINEYIPDYDIEGDIVKELNSYIKYCFLTNCKLARHRKKERKYEGSAWDYILRKFYKITYTYPRYEGVYHSLKALDGGSKLTGELRLQINEAVMRMVLEHSHITMKLMRAVNYLRFRHVEAGVLYDVKKYSNTIKKLTSIQVKQDFQIHTEGEFLPPSFMKTELILVDKNDKEQRHIPFNTLSSGEKQICYTLSSVFYHLVNIDTVGMYNNVLYETIDKGILGKDFKPVRYHHVNLIFDEMELYFHPEMQRQFINLFLDGLKQLPLNQIKSIHVMIATHSPFVLSDIPRSNILFLRKDGTPVEQNESMITFGGNIHSMLKHSFFLENGTVGEFALRTIQDVIYRINFAWLCLKNKKQEDIDEKDKMYLSLPKEMREAISMKNIDKYYNRKYIKKIIELIQEPVIKQKLLEEVYEINNHL